MSVRVLVVDDQELVRAGFMMILSSDEDIDVVGQASDGIEAIEAARRLRPDVVLMDIRMPRMDGLEATRLLKAEGRPSVRVLILTTFDPDQFIYKALQVGASGFVLKDVTPRDLLAAVHVVAKGDALLSPSVTRRLIGRFATQYSSSRPCEELQQLTESETQVLRLIAKGLSNGEIAGELYLSTATIKSHVASVLAELGLRDRVQAVVFAYEGVTRPSTSIRPPSRR